MGLLCGWGPLASHIFQPDSRQFRAGGRRDWCRLQASVVTTDDCASDAGGDIPRGQVPSAPGGDSPRVRGQDSRPRRRRTSPAAQRCPRPHKDVPARDYMSPDARSAPARAVGLDHECAPSHQPPGSPHLRRPAHPLPNNHGPASGTNKRPRTSGAGPAGVAAPVQARCSFSGGECSCHPSGTPNPERGHRTSSFGGILLPDPPS